jgi:peptidyl-tRNA hydrolase
MGKKRKRGVAKSAAVEKDLETSLAKLAAACAAGDVAVASRSKEAKQLASTTKRLGRKRAALIKRKRLAAKRAKATPSGETRRTLLTTVKDLTATRAKLEKARTVKAANITELAALKVAQRRANAYAKAIARADKALG